MVIILAYVILLSQGLQVVQQQYSFVGIHSQALGQRARKLFTVNMLCRHPLDRLGASRTRNIIVVLFINSD